MSESKPLAGRTILVTRPRGRSASLASALRSLGAEVIEAPAIAIEPPADFGPLDRALSRLPTYDWLVFTSANAVDAVFDRLKEIRPNDSPSTRKVAAVGPATAESLRERGLEADLVPGKFVAEEVFRALLERGEVVERRFLFPAADIARETLPELLRGAGALVEVVVAYRTVPAGDVLKSASSLVERGDVDLVTFTSASTARSFFARVDPRALEGRTKTASIGPVTSAALRDLGVSPDVEAERSTTEGLVEAILRHYRGN
ncbi:MAG TPA: uroporphyrinogen-III synthase [Vicinamibacteria bacterium]